MWFFLQHHVLFICVGKYVRICFFISALKLKRIYCSFRLSHKMPFFAFAFDFVLFSWLFVWQQLIKNPPQWFRYEFITFFPQKNLNFIRRLSIATGFDCDGILITISIEDNWTKNSVKISFIKLICICTKQQYQKYNLHYENKISRFLYNWEWNKKIPQIRSLKWFTVQFGMQWNRCWFVVHIFRQILNEISMINHSF